MTSTLSGKSHVILIGIAVLAVILIGYSLLSGSSRPAAGDVRVSAADGMTQVYIPAGPFIMGSSEDVMLAECRKYRNDCQPGFYRNMQPVHTVTLKAFWMDRTEVTNDMYARCVKAGKCREPDDAPLFGDEDYFGNPKYDLYPVRNVTFADARAYCAWAGRRLPNEAEWEKSARGTDGRLYPWGNEPATGSRGNYCDKNCPRSYRNINEDDGFVDTSPVGSFPAGASPYGVLDLAGNVREWTSSLYLPYPYQPDSGREDPVSTGNRVVRGSHWDGTADFALSAYRFEDFPDYQSTCVGIRCASSN
jgi:formylglycine-generating enzyme required for sulfatase activity